MKLKDRVAIVTGGGHGMGREMALAFAEEGANLVLPDINPSAAESVAQEVRVLGRKALPIPTDITIGKRL
jgi:NAD(P)-dependent dehydrogenase (short-subunit alcohol dehydrogenase family)